MLASDAIPTEVKGGCLCDSVRFKITFPSDHDFIGSNSTCQCVQCRKNSGALIWQTVNVPRSAVAWLSDSTLKNYASSPGVTRGFCSQCGGFLYWSREGDEIGMSVGCVDKEDLLRYSGALTTTRKHFYCAEAIPGVTDDLKGNKWKYDDEGKDAELMD